MTKKATAREPFLPLFVGDFMAATAEWEGEAVSLYATLLLHQWALGSIPADPKKICKLVRWDWELFAEHWKTVRRKFRAITITNEFDESEDRLINSRLEAHREKTTELRKKNAENGSKGAQARWQKDSERHSQNMAGAIKKNSGRHKTAIANATENNGEGHANRHQNQDGASDGIPSHPIPSHPISDTSYQDSTLEGCGEDDESDGDNDRDKGREFAWPEAGAVDTPESVDISPRENETPEGHMARVLRLLGVDVTSMHPVLVQWVKDGISVEQMVQFVAVARTSKPEGKIVANYLDRVVRNPNNTNRSPQASGGRRLTRYEQMQEALKNA